MTDLLQRSQTEDKVSTGINPADAARVLIASFTGTQLVSHVLEKRSDLPRRVDDLLRTFLSGVMTPVGREALEQILSARC